MGAVSNMCRAAVMGTRAVRMQAAAAAPLQVGCWVATALQTSAVPFIKIHVLMLKTCGTDLAHCVFTQQNTNGNMSHNMLHDNPPASLRSCRSAT